MMQLEAAAVNQLPRSEKVRVITRLLHPDRLSEAGQWVGALPIYRWRSLSADHKTMVTKPADQWTEADLMAALEIPAHLCFLRTAVRLRSKDVHPSFL